MPTSFRSSRVLITGAASGIGRALAETLAAEGASLALLDKDLRVAELAMALSKGDGRRVVSVVADLAAPGAARRSVDEAWDGLGGLDGLVNVAGIYPVTPALDLDEDEWDRVLGINLRAPFFCAQRFAGRLIAEGRRGRVVNVGSTASRLARVGIAHYGASKAGLNQLTRVLAVEWAPHGILVNAVLPGVIETERTRIHNRSEAARKEAVAKMARIPLRRFGSADNVVEMVLFLLSPRADYCTGALFTVDGGFTLGIPADAE